MRQLNLNEIRRDPQIEQLLKPINIVPNLEQSKGLPIGKTLVQNCARVPCSVCGYVNVPGLVICWVCGLCLDPRIKQLAEAQQS